MGSALQRRHREGLSHDIGDERRKGKSEEERKKTKGFMEKRKEVEKMEDEIDGAGVKRRIVTYQIIHVNITN